MQPRPTIAFETEGDGNTAAVFELLIEFEARSSRVVVKNVVGDGRRLFYTARCY